MLHLDASFSLASETGMDMQMHAWSMGCGNPAGHTVPLRLHTLPSRIEGQQAALVILCSANWAKLELLPLDFLCCVVPG